MNIKKEFGSGCTIIVIIISLIATLYFGLNTYVGAQSVYVHKHGKDIKVTVTDIKYRRYFAEISFVYEGKNQSVWTHNSVKVGDVVRVRKCENIDLFVHSGLGTLGWYLVGLIYNSVMTLLCSLPIWYIAES